MSREEGTPVFGERKELYRVTIVVIAMYIILCTIVQLGLIVKWLCLCGILCSTDVLIKPDSV